MGMVADGGLAGLTIQETTHLQRLHHIAIPMVYRDCLKKEKISSSSSLRSKQNGQTS